eukprot:COSAG05_NODE_2887_length_2539_cov_7.363115_2_plen_52_part_00
MIDARARERRAARRGAQAKILPDAQTRDKEAKKTGHPKTEDNDGPRVVCPR